MVAKYDFFTHKKQFLPLILYFFTTPFYDSYNILSGS